MTPGVARSCEEAVFATSGGTSGPGRGGRPRPTAYARSQQFCPHLVTGRRRLERGRRLPSVRGASRRREHPRGAGVLGAARTAVETLLLAAHEASHKVERSMHTLLVLYTCCLRIDSLLNARVEDLGYDKGHRVLHLEKMKGGGRKKKPIPPVAWDALQEYLDGRTEGWLFCTSSGGQLDEPAVWRLLQSLAKRAGLPLRGPHGTKGDAITHALSKKDARPDKVQCWADHRDSRTTQRYNRRKELLDDSPGYALATDVVGALEHGTS
ncbi:tyrosine-type recombinase/integrase [Streptomyces sp. NPDC090798]|uniref:tyrosine-type recombinase/integrase n=1 Tax=Streptomyces sp. NPDC090798 TaxID=3365968 RepID=UPI0038089673